jgi:hypothetical protein
VPLSLAAYMLGWTINQHCAFDVRGKYPERMHLLRLEDVLAAPVEVLGELCEQLGLERGPTLAAPSWNGEPLAEVSPWGTIRVPTVEANRATAEELTPAERAEVARRAGPYLDALGYGGFL